MKRTVYVYRAERGDKKTPPQHRKALAVFEIVERNVDKALALAKTKAEERFGERPRGAHMLVGDSISVMLPARA